MCLLFSWRLNSASARPSWKQVGDQGSGEEAQGWEEVPNSQITTHDVQFATWCTSLQSQNSFQPWESIHRSHAHATLIGDLLSPPFKTINQFACKIFPRLPPFPLKRGGEGVQPPPRTSHAFTKWRRVRFHCDTHESYPYFDYLRWCSRRMLTILKIDMQRKLPNIRIYS